MRLTPALICLFVTGFLFGGPEASAQSSRGSMGAHSRADVRISVSVLPRFRAEAASAARNTSGEIESTVPLSSNVPHLRYSVVPLEEIERSRGSRRAPADRLLVVVPD